MLTRRSVANALQTRIASGTLAPGKRLPSERSLAQEFGVSRSAVQGALRELETMGYLLRQPNCRPLVLSAGSAGPLSNVKIADQIAVWILPDMQDLGGNMILQGIRSVFGEGKYRLLIGCPPSPEQHVIWRAEAEFFNSLLENPKVAGVIVWDTGNPQCPQEYQALISAKIPLVFVDREPSVDITADVVAANNRRAAQRAVQHLTDMGHERIAMVMSADPASTLHDRFEGYAAALRVAGIKMRPEDVVELPAHWPKSREATEDLLIDLLRQQPPITAIFAATDRLALNILEASKSLKVSIPERISLVGFDWLMRWLPSGGELTSVNQPFEEIGRAAANAVLDQINATEPRTPRHILLDAPLIVKHSTAAPFGKKDKR